MHFNLGVVITQRLIMMSGIDRRLHMSFARRPRRRHPRHFITRVRDLHVWQHRQAKRCHGAPSMWRLEFAFRHQATQYAIRIHVQRWCLNTAATSLIRSAWIVHVPWVLGGHGVLLKDSSSSCNMSLRRLDHARGDVPSVLSLRRGCHVLNNVSAGWEKRLTGSRAICCVRNDGAHAVQRLWSN